MEHYDFRRVSATALVPAFARGQFTDIPFAKQMLDYLRANGANLSEGIWSERATTEYAAFFEARFKAVNRILEEQHAGQVLELAAGLSPRGLDFARRGVTYVEIDLAEAIDMIRDVIAAIPGAMHANLHLCPGNVLDREAMLACCSVFGAGPVAVTTEGLLRYLTFDEKTRLASNVRELLAQHGGMWITTDIHLRSWAERRTPIRRDRETERLGRNLNPNYFDDLEHATAFFEGCGFAVEPRLLLDGIRERVGTLREAPDELVAELEDRRVYILRAAQQH